MTNPINYNEDEKEYAKLFKSPKAALEVHCFFTESELQNPEVTTVNYDCLICGKKEIASKGSYRISEHLEKC